MDFQRLLGMDCNQINPIVELTQHVNEPQRLRENIGNASALETNQNNLMQPQSFRMNDLLTELKEINRPTTPLQPASSPAVQNFSDPGSRWANEFHRELQKRSQSRRNELNARNYENKTENVYSNSLEKRRSSMDFRPQNESLQSTFQEPVELLDDDKYSYVVESLDELEEIRQSEKNCTRPEKEINDKPIPKPNVNTSSEKKTIPHFNNVREFDNYLNNIIEESLKNEWKLTHPNQQFKQVTQEDILHSVEIYSHIENNPMENKSDENGMPALDNDCYSQVVLHSDEAVRKNNRNIKKWEMLTDALKWDKKTDRAILAAKQLLRIDPSNFHGSNALWEIYVDFECYYQACQSVFNWFKNNKLYNHLIPAEFTMEDKNTTKLDDDQLNSIKKIFLQAVQLNTKNPDPYLQVMIGNLYHLSNDLYKVIDCKLTAIEVSKELYNSELINIAFVLFENEQPMEALEVFKQLAKTKYKTTAYGGLAYVYMYLKDYKTAIYLFKRALGPENVDEESEFQVREITLYEEFQLCLRLAVKFSKM